jgi:hypothetical protein
MGPAPLDCDDFAFSFKGFNLEIPVFLATEQGDISAVAGYKIGLRKDYTTTKAHIKTTDDRGIATFRELQSTAGNNFFVEMVVPIVKDQNGAELP